MVSFCDSVCKIVVTLSEDPIVSSTLIDSLRTSVEVCPTDEYNLVVEIFSRSVEITVGVEGVNKNVLGLKSFSAP